MKLYKAYIQACIQPEVLLYGTAAQKKKKLELSQNRTHRKMCMLKRQNSLQKNTKSVLLKIF